MKINSTEKIHHEPKYILVYGSSGIGKTSLASTLDGPTLILDAESGLSVLEGKKIDYVSLSKNEDGTVVPEAERLKRLKEFMAYVQTDEAKKKYKYLFIDSLTECSQNILKTMKDQHGTDGYKLWGEYAAAMIDFLKFFRDARAYTVVFVALEDHVDDDVAGSYYCPNVGGKKVKSYILPVFDEVYRMVADKDGNRKLLCKPTSKTQAKTRTKTVLDIEEPNLGAIILKMRGDKK